MNEKTYALNQLNNASEKLLSEENNLYVTDVICYLRLKNLDDYQIEVIRNDVNVMVLEAQRRGKSAAEVLGQDYKVFCDGLLPEVRKKSGREVFLEHIEVIFQALLILIGISFVISEVPKSIIGSLFYSQSYDWKWAITMGNVISWVVLTGAAIAIFYFVASQPLSKTGAKRLKSKGFFLVAGMMGACLLLAYLTKRYFAMVLFRVNIFAVVALLLAGAVLNKHLDKRKQQ